MQYRKSELALKYAFRLRRYNAETSIFWLPAENNNTFHRAYVSIARSCWIPGHEDPAADVVELVRHWLEQYENGKWLMVIDNAANGEHDIPTTGKNSFMNSALFSRYVPKCAHGYILVTTRTAPIGDIFSKEELTEVGNMNEEESCTLIRRRLPHEESKQDIAALAVLHKMSPLALVQATSEIMTKALGLKGYIRSYLTRDTPYDSRDADINERVVAFPKTQHATTAEELQLLRTLPYAEGAAYDSRLWMQERTCAPGTRTDVLNHIMEWSENDGGPGIFWLAGMAGTGKSTIARTVASHLAEQKRLGASFFFSRGHGDLESATKFFTTIALQLADAIPGLVPHIVNAAESHPNIAKQSLTMQWKTLVFQPLSRLTGTLSLPRIQVLVVDALDECDSPNDMQLILKSFADLCRLSTVQIKTFVTSRPETSIRLGIHRHAEGMYLLHDISRLVVDRDISIFLEHELEEIREEHDLPLGWPGEHHCDALVRKSDGLFIWAATVCRFLRATMFQPDLALPLILEDNMVGKMAIENLDRMYARILEHSIRGYDAKEKEKFAKEFREVVGSIVMLMEPLSTASLARLIGLSKNIIDHRLDLLHSVLDIPANPDSPVRLLHLSFRDFLLNKDSCVDAQFWVDENQAHSVLVGHCINLMSATLGQDICDLRAPGILTTEIESRVKQCLSPEIEYACIYWVRHIQRSCAQLYDNDQVHQFLQEHFLHWLEALSLIGKASEGVLAIVSLESYIYVSHLT